MTREEVLNMLVWIGEEAYRLYKSDGEANFLKAVETENMVWTLCSDWNRKHEDEEIEVSETCDEDGHKNGFQIEDYPFYYEYDYR